MKKLIIDIKDGYAALAAGGDYEPGFFKIEFDESDFAGSTSSSSTMGLFELADDNLKSIYDKAEEFVLVIPMRFSMVKPISIDVQAVEYPGQDFLAWEAGQQLPPELGDFQTGFYRLRSSFDNKMAKYLFYASSKDFVDVLANFVHHDPAKKLRVESEAYGLLNAIDIASGGEGLGAAISLEHDGASVVITHDGDFLAGRFIPGDNPALGQEIMYFIIANCADALRPKILVCGDLEYLSHLGKIGWADRLDISAELGLAAVPKSDNPMLYVVAAGINKLNAGQT